MRVKLQITLSVFYNFNNVSVSYSFVTVPHYTSIDTVVDILFRYVYSASLDLMFNSQQHGTAIWRQSAQFIESVSIARLGYSCSGSLNQWAAKRLRLNNTVTINSHHSN